MLNVFDFMMKIIDGIYLFEIQYKVTFLDFKKKIQNKINRTLVLSLEVYFKKRQRKTNRGKNFKNSIFF